MSKGPITEQDVRYAAKLSRLALSDEEVHRLQGQMSDILTHIDELSSLDLPSLPRAEPLPVTLREDVAVPSLSRDTALAAAPSSTQSEFRVPAVMTRVEE